MIYLKGVWKIDDGNDPNMIYTTWLREDRLFVYINCVYIFTLYIFTCMMRESMYIEIGRRVG